MNKKAELFERHLQEMEISWFQKAELKDEYETIIYDSYLPINGKKFPVFVILDQSLFTIVRVVLVANVSAGKKRQELVEFLNELNAKFKLMKYYINDKDDVLSLDISIPALDHHFDSETILYLIAEIVRPHLEEYVPKFEEFF